MKHKFLQFCSTVLALVMLLQTLPVAARGAEDTTGDLQASSAQTAGEVCVVLELPQGRGEYQKEFLLSNGNRLAAVYAHAVHYEKDGSWLEIDNTLTLSGEGKNAAYTNAAGPWQVSFPRQLSGSSAVTVTKDGHTLSFAMSGQLLAPTLEEIGNVPALTLSQPGSAVAQLAEQTRTDAAADLQYPETVAETHDTGLMYSGIFKNTDIRYDLTSNRIKESVIIGSHDAALRGYRYTLQTGELVPVLQEDGQIFFLDRNKESPVMVMPAPFLFDDAGEYCYNVDVTLTGSNGSYMLTYLLDETWLADPNRQYPVVLDPVIYASPDVNNIQDVSVYEKKDEEYQKGVLLWGNTPRYGIMRGFVKYNVLPALTSSDTIVKATLSLRVTTAYSTVATVQIHKVLEDWESSTTTWNNHPDWSDTIEDFGQLQAVAHYLFDVTDIARGWYEGENTGLMFRATDAVENAANPSDELWMITSSDLDIYHPENAPNLLIEFRSSNGLERYWDYASASAGRAGTGYVNSYTGNLVWVRPDIGFGGNRMPVSISHVYNANDAQGNPFGLGHGWRTNFNQLVYHWDEENAYDDYYVWEDGDGTSHYFKKESEGVYKDEDGLELTLQVTTSGRTITDKYGNTSTFDTQGRLIRQSNNQQTQSHITVTYDGTSKRIAKITDGVGRAYNFTYPGGLLSRISYTGTGTDEVSFVSFGYSGSNLTSVTDKDGKSSTFTYSSNHLLLSAKDIDGYQLAYTYSAPGNPTWQPYRVKTVAESDGTAQGGTLSIEYAHNQTTFTDHNGHVQIVQFNNLGNPLSVQDGEGRAQFAGYALDGTEEAGDSVPANAKNNQLRISSKLQNTVSNRIKISDFEDGACWTQHTDTVTCENTTEAAYQGSRSMKIERTGSNSSADAVGDIVVANPGETYTFSAYVKTGSATACILIWNGSFSTFSVTLPANTDWTRLEVSYTATSTVTLTPFVYTRSLGTAYIDCAQMEKTATASRYNLITNGDFRFSGTPAYGWSGTGLSSADIPAAVVKADSTPDAAAPQLDNTAFRITGAPSATKKLSQTVKISGSAGDSFVLSGWAKGDSAPLTDDTRKFALKATVNHTDGTSQDFSVSFNPDADSSINWQYAALPIVTEKAYSSITVTLDYSNNVNTAYFDGIQLFKEAFGSSYTYDAKGNVTAVKDIQGGTTAYTYNTTGDLTKQTLPSGSVLTYEYDSKHNVTKATSAEGVVYTLTYDTWGNNLTVSIGSGITTTATYTSDGNRLSTAKDAAGNITTYSYNANTNVLDWVKYPNDTDTTRTNYTYDSMYRLATAAATTNTGSALTATYTYTDDLLTKLQTATTAYHFVYGDFALRSSIQVGSTTLASYTYTADRNRYLQQLTYGNQDFVRYAYDSYGRLTTQTYEDGSTVRYAYDNTGALATVTDSASGIKTTYYYDLTDRLIQYTETGTGHSHAVGYVYDRENKLTSLTEKINGTAFTTSYTYDDDNRVTSVTDRGITESYTYDAYGRVTQKVTKNGSATVLTETYTYRTVSGKPTGQIATHRSVSAGRDVTYSYNYDANGNITSVSDGTHTTTYVYDSANQLTRENNQADGVTRTFTYDRAGNITAWTEYAYTTGTLGAATATHGYTYDTNNWGDLLTAWNGNTITSDTIGNMLSDGTRTYTWRNGRELATVTKGGSTWTNTYDADGMRTKRTNGTNTYSYIYNGGSLSQMTVDGTVLNFAYDASGTPMAVTYGGTTYYYATNIQGDVIAILNASGTAVVTYTYDAWGNILTTTGTLASTLGTHNPLRYRGYVYDPETGLYYLQSRYYNPQMGRFICADSLVSTGQGILGNNMFAYCGNNPVNHLDPDGYLTLAIAGGGYLVTAGTVGAANIWNPVGWIIIGTVVIVSGVIIGVNIYNSSKSSTNNSEVDPYARPGQKKQGRERKNKARKKDDWKPKSNPKPPKKHTPGRDHRRFR